MQGDALMMLPLREDLVPIRAQPVQGDPLGPGIHFQASRDLTHPDVTTGHRPGHRVAIGTVGHIGIAAHAPRDVRDVRVRRPVRERLQMRALCLPGVPDDLVRRAVDALIGHRRHPGVQLAAQVLHGARLPAGQEAPFQIADAGFDLSLRLRPIGPTQARLKPPVAREVQKDRMPAHLAALIGAQHDRLDPVVEDLLGDAT